MYDIGRKYSIVYRRTIHCVKTVFNGGIMLSHRHVCLTNDDLVRLNFDKGFVQITKRIR